MSSWLLFVLPWIVLPLYLALRVRLPRALPAVGDRVVRDALEQPTGPPLVSIVVPARDEAHNIGTLLASLTRSTWPRFEIVVVDDRSRDGTGDIARTADRGNAERLVVVDGAPLPEGWMGKPWACRQGAERARGDLLLFTDADTRHAPDLLTRAVAGLVQDGADALTLAGRQLMESFWERLVQPQILMTMVYRYQDLSRPVPRERWRSAIANGQFILFRREVYEAIDGHGSVRHEIVEDLRLAQILVRGGWRFRIREASSDFATRMYRSLSELVTGWSKNVVLGGIQTLPPAWRPLIPPTMVASLLVMWLLPPGALIAALAGWLPTAFLPWSAAVVGVSGAFWCVATARFGAPWYYGLLYPAGAAVTAWIFLRSWMGMRRVSWKGRTYATVLTAD